MDREEVKARLIQGLEACRQELIDLSLRIHDNPELGFQEIKASTWLAEYLEGNGFAVERGICQLATAFRGSYGLGRPAIALLAEYDALPQMGHGCGHNIIAASAAAAGVAAKAAVDRFGGSILVIGTPAEELYGGKALMVARHAFDGVDVAMMVHPATRDAVITQTLACANLEVEFFGKEAHAAARPAEGINALEAMILAFNGINSLRQHIREKARIHGIITDGGQAANIVPAHSAGTFLVRAQDEAYLDELGRRVINCFEAASLASGARLEYRWRQIHYAALRTNLALAQVFTENMESLGRQVEPLDPNRGFGSTDMGNVSTVVPSIHPMVAIAPAGLSSHSPEFAAAAASETGHRGLLDAAKALAMSVVDLLARPEIMAKVQEEFAQAQPD